MPADGLGAALVLACLCGGAGVALRTRPDFIHACNCTLCAKTGARWGYFAPADVTLTGATQGYVRQDKADPGARIHFCPTCGATTHFRLIESAIARFGDTMTGVNMALADERDLAGIEMRYPDGRAWPGEGDFAYVRPAREIGADDPA